MLAGAAGCERGDARACQDACDLGHSNSCQLAGRFREKQDPSGARSLYDLACAGGSGLGCESAGRLHATGIGGPIDLGAAAKLDRQARFYLRVHCDRRHAASCLALGQLYATSRGGPAAPAVSAVFFARACSLGLAQACDPAGVRPD